MLVLAFDTSSTVASIGVLAAEPGQSRLWAGATENVSERHGGTLLPHVDETLRKAGVGVGEIGLVVAGLGPGSFTGLRVGLATAKGIAFAKGIPLVGVSTHLAIARGAEGDLGGASKRLIVMTDAHKNEVYVSVFETDPLRQTIPTRHLSPVAAAEQFGPAVGAGAILLGDGLIRYAAAFEKWSRAQIRNEAALSAPGPAALALCGYEKFMAHGADDAMMLEPLYVRGSDAKLPAPKK